MTYTPTDQLPPPPQWMLDEVADAEQAHLTDLMNQCFTIRTFRKQVLPIYYKYKSATGKIMGDAIEAWKEGQIALAKFRKEKVMGFGSVPDYFLVPWERNDWEVSHANSFNNLYWESLETQVYNDGDWRPHIYTCPSKQMRKAMFAFTRKQVNDFLATKTGKVYATRSRTYHEIMDTWRITRETSKVREYGPEFNMIETYSPRPQLYRGFWEILDAWKAMKFKKMEGREAYNIRYPEGTAYAQ